MYLKKIIKHEMQNKSYKAYVIDYYYYYINILTIRAVIA